MATKRSRTRSKPTPVEGVLIVGGGYAGVHAARQAMCAGERATIIDPSGQHDFVTRLAAVAGGTAPRRDASSPLDDFADAVIVGSVSRVDDGVVELANGRRFSADAVVVTAGAVPVAPPIPGLELARQLRTADDALALRPDIKEAESVVIVGGGATGVQLAGAIRARRRRVEVTLIDGSDRLLAGLSAASSRDAARILGQRGVDIRLGVDAEAIEAGGVVVDGVLVAGLPVWAAGYDARAESLGLPVASSGRASVGNDLLVSGWSSTFAAGDVAHHVDAAGDELAMSAQIAVQAGEAAGANAARLLTGEPLEPAELTHAGWVLDLGGSRGLAEIAGVPLTSPFLDLLPPLLHWGIDIKHLIETRGLAGISHRPSL